MKQRRSQFVGLVALAAITLTTLNVFTTVPNVSAQTALYTSCEADKLTTPLTAAASATQSATMSATTSPTMAATLADTAPAATSTGSDNIAFLSVVGGESQACYLTTETFLSGNPMGLKAGFNGAVGITTTLKGDIALDLTNVANSQIGDLVINISEFKSDNERRDGFIRNRFLESNKYPYATLTDATVMGLPTGPYTDGSPLQFKVQGTLTVHNTKRPTTFDVTGTYTGGTLVVKAVTDLNMSDFGIQVPNIGGLLKVEDMMRLEVNIVARAQVATAAPTK